MAINSIKRARLIAGITQDEMAEKLHVSRETVWKWEAGRMFPSVRRLKEVAEVLNTTAAKLIRDKERAG